MRLFNLFKKKKTEKIYTSANDGLSISDIEQRHCLFENDCIINVTNFDVKTPEDSMGYLCSGNISVFNDGTLVTASDSEKECFHISSVLRYNDNINNYDPCQIKSVNFLLEDKCIEVTFKNSTTKQILSDTLKQIVTNNTN